MVVVERTWCVRSGMDSDHSYSRLVLASEGMSTGNSLRFCPDIFQVSPDQQPVAATLPASGSSTGQENEKVSS